MTVTMVTMRVPDGLFTETDAGSPMTNTPDCLVYQRKIRTQK